jgi:hypothetical protein
MWAGGFSTHGGLVTHMADPAGAIGATPFYRARTAHSVSAPVTAAGSASIQGPAAS